MSSEKIECSAHGPAYTTFVCRHVAEGEGLGFVYDQNAREPWPDAVCSACAGEPPWGEEVARERIRLLCSRCWEAARTLTIVAEVKLPPLTRWKNFMRSCIGSLTIHKALNSIADAHVPYNSWCRLIRQISFTLKWLA